MAAGRPSKRVGEYPGDKMYASCRKCGWAGTNYTTTAKVNARARSDADLKRHNATAAHKRNAGKTSSRLMGW